MPSSAKHKLILEAVLATIQGLSLSGISNASIVERVLPVDRQLTPPFVLVTEAGQETELPGTTGADDWGYPVLVAIVSASNQSTATVDGELLWRERVRKAFHNKRLAGITSVWRCLVEPGPVIDPTAWQQANLTVSTLTVRVISREVRS